MSSIRQALQKLDGVVGKLEGTIEGLEEALAGEQRDMFSEPEPSNENGDQPGNEPENGAATPAGSIDGTILVSRLDGAIEKVEELLREG